MRIKLNLSSLARPSVLCVVASAMIVQACVSENRAEVELAVRCQSNENEADCKTGNCVWDDINGCLSPIISSCPQATSVQTCSEIFLCEWSIQESCVRSYFRSNEKRSWAQEITKPSNYTNDMILLHPAEISFEQNTQNQFATEDFQVGLDAISRSTLTAGNRFEYLLDGDSFERKLALIDQARTSIHAFYFSMACDETGDRFAAALTRASKRGVDVWVILSGDWESWSQTFNVDKYIQRGGNCYNTLITNGVKVLFSTTLLHEKGLVVDGTNAIVGGQNIADNWSLSNGDNEYFRDTDLLVSGPVVTQIERRFIEMLNSMNTDTGTILKIFTKIEELEDSYITQGLIGNQHGEYSRWFTEKRGGLCRFTYQEPSRKNFSLLKTYEFLVNNLQHQLVMQVPQLDMGGTRTERYPLRRAITNFSNRGGRVDIITNGPGYIDSKIVDNYYLIFKHVPTTLLSFVKSSIADGFASTTYDNIIGTRFNVYAYRRWTHGKVWMFDNTMVSNSSFNFDYSADTWSECALLCMDDELVRQTERMFREDVSRSRNISQLLP